MMNAPETLKLRYPNLYPKDSYVSYPPGWGVIVDRLSMRLATTRVYVVQLKAKYGGLLVHVYGRDASSVGGAIAEAEAASLRTCDQCGEPGVLREVKNRWLFTRCDIHAEGAGPLDSAAV